MGSDLDFGQYCSPSWSSGTSLSPVVSYTTYLCHFWPLVPEICILVIPSSKMFWLALPSYTWSKIFTIKTRKQDSRTRPSLVLIIFSAFETPLYRPDVIRTCRIAHFDCFQLAEELI